MPLSTWHPVAAKKHLCVVRETRTTAHKTYNLKPITYIISLRAQLAHIGRTL